VGGHTFHHIFHHRSRSPGPRLRCAIAENANDQFCLLFRSRPPPAYVLVSVGGGGVDPAPSLANGAQRPPNFCLFSMSDVPWPRPMYLQAIGEHFPHWPRTANGSLSYFPTGRCPHSPGWTHFEGVGIQTRRLEHNQGSERCSRQPGSGQMSWNNLKVVGIQ